MYGENYSRRQVLAGVGGVSVVSVLGATALPAGATEFTRTTVADGVRDLQLDWRETYNGTVLDESLGKSDRPGPGRAVVALGTVMPGDRGTLSVRIQLAGQTEPESTAVAPALALDLLETNENGINDPEAAAGDDSPDTGELQSLLDTAVWYDDGALDIDELGANNADRDVGEGLIAEGAEGSLAEVATALADGVVLDEAPATGGSKECLDATDAITVTLGWQFDPDDSSVPSNVGQGDSVAFDLRIIATQCSNS